MRDVTVIADDLTGAANCGVAFAVSGVTTFVALGEAPGPASARVVAVDTDSRHLEPQAAADRVHATALRAYRGGSRAVFKRVDPTLLGNVGPEVAATYRAAVEASQGKRFLVVGTPALPSEAHTVRDGRVFVGGTPLEETEAWRSSGRAGGDDLVATLRLAGLTTSGVRRDGVRMGPDRFARELAQLAAGGVEAVVCDAEDESDLEAVAAAGVRLPLSLIWAGSAGLARHLPRALGLERAGVDSPRHTPPPVQGRTRASGPLLVLVGGSSSLAREQARQVARETGVESVVVPAEVLLEGESGAGWPPAAEALRRALESDRDVVLLIEGGRDVRERQEGGVAAAMGRLAAAQAGELGGLIATGGDVARAALHALGAGGIHILGEVEPGVPIGMTEEPWPLLVVTKAEAAGDPSTLRRCRAALKRR